MKVNITTTRDINCCSKRTYVHDLKQKIYLCEINKRGHSYHTRITFYHNHKCVFRLYLVSFKRKPALTISNYCSIVRQIVDALHLWYLIHVSCAGIHFWILTIWIIHWPNYGYDSLRYMWSMHDDIQTKNGNESWIAHCEHKSIRNALFNK